MNNPVLGKLSYRSAMSPVCIRYGLFSDTLICWTIVCEPLSLSRGFEWNIDYSVLNM
jgi:hypothetical protein